MKLLPIAVLFAGLAVASPATADPGPVVDFGLRLTTPAPTSPTGMVLHAEVRGERKPPPLRSAVFSAPGGTRFATAILPECTVSDAEIRLLGSDACPPETKLTVGSLTGISGFGPPLDPLVADVHVFNARNQILEIVTFPGTSVSPAADRVTIDGSTLTAHPPRTPGGPPDGEMAIKSIDYAITGRTTAAGSYITTPRTCPDSGYWTSRGRFLFGNGDTAIAVSRTPCHAGSRRRPALRLQVKPRRVRAGGRVRLRFRARSRARRCTFRARIRFAGRTVRTDRRGRGRWTGRLRRQGLRRARVSHSGCRNGAAAVRVLRRGSR